MSDSTLLKGKAWVGGDDIYAFDIIQAEHWTSPLDPDDNSRWVMAGIDPAFEKENAFKERGYAFVVAGSNFGGGGKSIEHPILGLIGAGIQAVIANSFARLQFRNAVNNGLPFIICEAIADIVETGDELEVDVGTGRIRNLTTGQEGTGDPVAGFVMDIREAGGLISYIREKIADGTIKGLR
jgi:3-isopropylmalate/(R)-2-methylmalate dehydratase small subunit